MEKKMKRRQGVEGKKNKLKRRQGDEGKQEDSREENQVKKMKVINLKTYVTSQFLGIFFKILHMKSCINSCISSLCICTFSKFCFCS
jgi:hypothetical protein